MEQATSKETEHLYAVLEQTQHHENTTDVELDGATTAQICYIKNLTMNTLHVFPNERVWSCAKIPCSQANGSSSWVGSHGCMVLTDQIADNDASSGENSDEGDCDSLWKSRSATESLIQDQPTLFIQRCKL